VTLVLTLQFIFKASAAVSCISLSTTKRRCLAGSGTLHLIRSMLRIERLLLADSVEKVVSLVGLRQKTPHWPAGKHAA
jgi:hypothetical protein